MCSHQINKQKKNQNKEIKVESEYDRELINAIKEYCTFAAMDTSVK